MSRDTLTKKLFHAHHLSHEQCLLTFQRITRIQIAFEVVGKVPVIAAQSVEHWTPNLKVVGPDPTNRNCHFLLSFLTSIFVLITTK